MALLMNSELTVKRLTRKKTHWTDLPPGNEAVAVRPVDPLVTILTKKSVNSKSSVELDRFLRNIIL
jgi:hypothetical protein